MHKRRTGSKDTKVLDAVMMFVSFIAPLGLLPQIIEVFTTKQVEGLSLFSFLYLATLQLLWIVYGLKHRAYPVIVTATLFAVFQYIIAFGIIAFS